MAVCIYLGSFLSRDIFRTRYGPKVLLRSSPFYFKCELLLRLFFKSIKHLKRERLTAKSTNSNFWSRSWIATNLYLKRQRRHFYFALYILQSIKLAVLRDLSSNTKRVWFSLESSHLTTALKASSRYDVKPVMLILRSKVLNGLAMVTVSGHVATSSLSQSLFAQPSSMHTTFSKHGMLHCE